VIFCVLGIFGERLVHILMNCFLLLRVLLACSGVAQVGVFCLDWEGGDMADMAGVWGMYMLI
jgi:hypothetical protein